MLWCVGDVAAHVAAVHHIFTQLHDECLPERVVGDQGNAFAEKAAERRVGPSEFAYTSETMFTRSLPPLPLVANGSLTPHMQNIEEDCPAI